MRPIWNMALFAMRGILVASLIVINAPAYAQSQSVQQSGAVTAGHATCWTTNGVVQDCGTSVTPGITTLGLYGTGLPECIQNVKSTAGQYYRLCFGYATGSTAGIISLTPFGGAPDIPLNLIIDGVTIPIGGSGNWVSALFDAYFGSVPGDMPCRGTSVWAALSPGGSGQYLQTNGSSGCPTWVTPGSVFSNPIRTISSGTTDTASSTDQSIAWNSSSTSEKAQNIFACSSGVTGRVLIIKDEIGTAGTYSITITPTSGTIDGFASYLMPFNLQAVMLQCDGSTGNWMTL